MSRRRVLMPSDSGSAKSPEVKKLGPRRVRTEPFEGQQEEPDSPGVKTDSTENDDRLKADKPPHY
jgi:hypothetical protein